MNLLLKKKKRKALLLSFEELERADIRKTLPEVEERIKEIMREHIGEAEAISHLQLWEEVMGINAETLDIYQKEYWWNLIKAVMRKLRAEGNLFTINKVNSVFVLKSQEEANDYKEKVNITISALKASKEKADKWVQEERWRSL